MEILVGSLVAGILLGMVLALVALGLTIIFGVMDIVNFAHGEFLMIGMYTGLLDGSGHGRGSSVHPACCRRRRVSSRRPLLQRVRQVPPARAHGRPTPRDLRSHAVPEKPGAARSSAPKTGPCTTGSSWARASTSAWASSSRPPSWRPPSSLSCPLSGVWLLMNRTKIGKALTATALNGQGARYMGIPTERMNALAWGIGGATVTIAGALHRELLVGQSLRGPSLHHDRLRRGGPGRFRERSGRLLCRAGGRAHHGNSRVLGLFLTLPFISEWMARSP